MLLLTRKIGTSVMIGDPRSTQLGTGQPPVEIILLDVDYYEAQATLGITAPPNISREILDAEFLDTQHGKREA